MSAPVQQHSSDYRLRLGLRLGIRGNYASDDVSGNTTKASPINIGVQPSFGVNPNRANAGKPATPTSIFTSNRVWFIDKPNTYMAGAKGSPVILENNSLAEDPTWEELKSFLLEDKTDTLRYIPNSFVCADFAMRLHNNAEKYGWRCYLVGIQLGPSDDYPTGASHAINAFNTTDYGWIYIDCTAPLRSNGQLSSDKFINLVIGERFTPNSVFPTDNWAWMSMGKVLKINAFSE